MYQLWANYLNLGWELLGSSGSHSKIQDEISELDDDYEVQVLFVTEEDVTNEFCS